MLELLGDMRRRGFVPDVATYEAAVLACCRGNDHEAALALLDEARLQHGVVQASTHRTAMDLAATATAATAAAVTIPRVGHSSMLLR